MQSLATSLGREEIAQLRNKTLLGQAKEAVIIPQSEIEKIRKNAQVTTKEHLWVDKIKVDEEKKIHMEKAQKKKEIILEFDKTRTSKIPLNDIEIAEKEKNETSLTKAQRMMDEELDDVKKMNEMVLYAKCAAIRDKQLIEHKEISKQRREEELQKDMMMEVERLKAVKFYEDKVNQASQIQKQGALVIIDQIKERDAKRIKEEELKLKEQASMKKMMDEMDKEELRQNDFKLQKAASLRKEVELANKETIHSKIKKKLADRELDKQIMEYNKLKAEREEEIIKEQKRIQQEKEVETQKLRERQEKASDKQSEIDALRAKRAFEGSERRIREKEKNEAIEMSEKIRILEEARKKQSEEKEQRLAEQAKQERDEFMRIIQKQKEAQQLEKKKEDEKKRIFLEHGRHLKEAIYLNEEKKNIEKREFLEEGRKVREKLDKGKQKLEEIKKEKLDHLNQLSIPNKYKSDLEKLKVI